MLRNGVVMVIGDIQATDTVDIVDILITEDTTEEGGVHITGLIIEAIMATRMAAATTAGVEGIGLVSGSKDEYACRTEYEH
jgi:poly(3-hydroxybutyrate) depolymerase